MHLPRCSSIVLLVFMNRVSFSFLLREIHYSYYRTEVDNKICQVVILNYNCIVVIGACVRCSRCCSTRTRATSFDSQWMDRSAEKTNGNRHIIKEKAATSVQRLCFHFDRATNVDNKQEREKCQSKMENKRPILLQSATFHEMIIWFYFVAVVGFCAFDLHPTLDVDRFRIARVRAHAQSIPSSDICTYPRLFIRFDRWSTHA